MPYTNRELFARLIQCEAEGEGDDGMRAVSSVIMNRVKVPYGEFIRLIQGDVRKAIAQAGQFTCMKEVVAGSYNAQNIYNMNPQQIHYDIADWALSGNTLGAVANSLWYFNPFNPKCTPFFPPGGAGIIFTRINLHCFYIPTQKYSTT
ncbi:MAG TPA: cell wall hydrolase [Ruminiclostridium sp.]